MLGEMQHAEVMAWCARHQFLDNVPPRFTSIGQWLTAVEERKSAAQERAWSDGLQTAAQLGSGQQGSLFIEDALANLRTASDDDVKAGSNKDFLELGWLREAALVLTTPSLRYMQDAVSVQSGMLYLPNNVHAAVDKLFLEGSSDLILAKKAIVSSHLYLCRDNQDIQILEDIPCHCLMYPILGIESITCSNAQNP
jgi:E3 ubiquitin-protein ligase HOS1